MVQDKSLDVNVLQKAQKWFSLKSYTTPDAEVSYSRDNGSVIIHVKAHDMEKTIRAKVMSCNQLQKVRNAQAAIEDRR